MKYKAIIPFIPSMGSISPIHCSSSSMETAEENLLWTLNSMRRHDGLKEWKNIPPSIREGIVFKPISD